MLDFPYDADNRLKETDEQFLAKVAAASAQGRWDGAWLPRLLELARRGARQSPPPRAALADDLIKCLDRTLGDRFGWRSS